MIPALFAGPSEDGLRRLPEVAQTQTVQEPGDVDWQRCRLDRRKPRRQVAPASELVG